jgi:glycosyltransferase involved in cell wall biosynthesis
MRIVYVINSVEGGGAALPVPAVAQVLAQNGATVEILALTRRDGRGLAPMRAAGLGVQVREGGERDHLAAFRWLDQQVVDLRPDLIWTSLTRATLLGQLVGRQRGVPVVSWQHNAFLKPANRILLRASQGLTKLWVCDSESVTALTAQRLGVEPARLATWPLFAADPTAQQAQPWHRGEPLRLGSLGRLHPAKGYDVLIAALGRMRAAGFRSPVRFSVAIAGEGHARQRLEAALREHGVENVHLLGFNDRPRDFLAGLHLYVQPSRAEGLCIAAHEAMQAGLPTIVSSVGQLAYSVEDRKTGLIVPPGDPKALANALMTLLSQPHRLATMGAAARSRVLDRFGAPAFAAAGAEVLRRLGARAETSGGGEGRKAEG